MIIKVPKLYQGATSDQLMADTLLSEHLINGAKVHHTFFDPIDTTDRDLYFAQVHPNNQEVAFQIPFHRADRWRTDADGVNIPQAVAFEPISFTLIDSLNFEVEISGFRLDDSMFRLYALQEGYISDIDAMFYVYKQICLKRGVSRIEGHIVHWVESGVYDDSMLIFEV